MRSPLFCALAQGFRRSRAPSLAWGVWGAGARVPRGALDVVASGRLAVTSAASLQPISELCSLTPRVGAREAPQLAIEPGWVQYLYVPPPMVGEARRGLDMAKKRRKLPMRKSQRMFAKHARVHPRNNAPEPERGGTKL